MTEELAERLFPDEEWRPSITEVIEHLEQIAEELRTIEPSVWVRSALVYLREMERTALLPTHPPKTPA